jgi:hypothetical protein
MKRIRLMKGMVIRITHSEVYFQSRFLTLIRCVIRARMGFHQLAYSSFPVHRAHPFGLLSRVIISAHLSFRVAWFSAGNHLFPDEYLDRLQ